MKFKILDQGATADVEFEAYGQNLEELFENAAFATFSVISDPKKVESKTREDIEVKSENIESLLYDFLEEFLIFHDSKNMVFSSVKVNEIKKVDDEFCLKGFVLGESFDEKKHDVGSHVKAITYHGMKVEKKENRYICKVLLDI